MLNAIRNFADPGFRKIQEYDQRQRLTFRIYNVLIGITKYNTTPL